MSALDPMSPEASPGIVSRRSGVRRVNNLPVILVGAVATVFVVIMAVVAADRAARQNQPAAASTQPEKAGSTTMFAKAIAGDLTDGVVPAARPAPPAVPDDFPPQPYAIPIARPDDLDLPPLPPADSRGGLTNSDQRPNPELERVRTAKLQQFEEAIKARTAVQIVPPRSVASAGGRETGLGAGTGPSTREETLARLAAVRQQIDAQSHDDPTAAYQARLQQLRAAGLDGRGGVGDGNRADGASDRGAAGRNGLSQFGRSGAEDRWRLDSQPEAPRSRYELRAGFVVPATLISGINSDLPGQIIAQVSQDVFDTATGRWKLIPQGSRLVGSYASDIAYGQSRILVAWQRIVFPDGKAMDIGAMPGADSAGYGGFSDRANNHYVRLFASALLMSGVTAAITNSQRQNQAQSSLNAPTASSALSEALGQQLGQVTAQLVAKNMNIAPTLEIRPGYRFNVIVTKDMTFAGPYQAFDYATGG